MNAEVPNRMALFRYIAGLIPKLKTRTGAAVVRFCNDLTHPNKHSGIKIPSVDVFGSLNTMVFPVRVSLRMVIDHLIKYDACVPSLTRNLVSK